MPRYGCFEIRTTCGSCGSPLPINGPYTRYSCTSCFEDVTVPQDRIADFLNDFEEEYEGFTEGQGSGGTIMCGSGTYKYSQWRLSPRCSSCKTPLAIPEVQGKSILKCSKCAAEYHVFPAPDWLLKKVPSARFFITQQPPPGENDVSGLKIDENSSKPVVMSCPQCAGALSVSARSERIMECSYCNSEVYVPDAIWKRLHPVRKTEEWFVCFEGRNKIQLQAARRAIDLKDEKEELMKWRLKNTPKKVGMKFKSILRIFGIFFAIVVVTSVIFALSGKNGKDISGMYSRYAPFLIIPIAVGIPVWLALKGLFSAQIGKGKGCKQALALLAGKHDWKHESAEYKSSLGYIDTKYLGRDIEINPGDEYAIEVEINDSPFYLKTEPPGYPHDGVQRFTTGDSRFDNLFPFRYATPELAERIEKSPEEAAVVLAPVYWFLGRWQQKLGRLKIDWCDAAVHLIPGHVEVMDSGNRYLLPQDMEPLLEDMIVLASGLDAIASGREPELP
ncbi:hypothetical protein DRQ25_11910 [Candidatus Fermentibacteria bacterium]|nr:MAG: hypothetical protein DRQ25_11910 [Candidatus Fermentibacteria bacterium]